MAIAIVQRPLLRVGKDRVSLGNFLESLLRLRIIRIAIGMPLHGQLAISTLQLNFGYGAADAQHFVIVAFCVRGQNWRLSFMRDKTGLENYFPGFLATFTIAGRSSRSFNL